MLPNWLYGKSKSKLAELLGGGGTPPDYNQVKAQVTQNTENIALLDTSNQALTDQSNSMVNVLGAKNIVPNNAVSKTVNGITFTVNSDGSVTVNGTASAYTQFDLNSGIEYKEGKYALNGCPSGGGSNTYVIWVRNSATTVGVTDKGSGATLNVTNADIFKASIIVYSGATVNNLTFYPMLRLASITDDTYAPYAKTNAELTSNVNDIYSNLLKTSLCESAAISVSANTDYAGTITPTTIAGYKPIGVIGFRLYGSGYTQIYASEMRLDSSDNLVHYSIRSDVLSGAVSITVHAIVLYIKD